eukprot:scaffold67832_cov18-Tisochrysis_lutea.AAC.1
MKAAKDQKGKGWPHRQGCAGWAWLRSRGTVAQEVHGCTGRAWLHEHGCAIWAVHGANTEGRLEASCTLSITLVWLWACLKAYLRASQQQQFIQDEFEASKKLLGSRGTHR